MFGFSDKKSHFARSKHTCRLYLRLTKYESWIEVEDVGPVSFISLNLFPCDRNIVILEANDRSYSLLLDVPLVCGLFGPLDGKVQSGLLCWI